MRYSPSLIAPYARVSGRRKRSVTAFITDRHAVTNSAAILARLPVGSLVIIRDYDCPDRAALAAVLLRHPARRKQRLRMLIAGDAELAYALGANGVHAPERSIKYIRGWKKRYPRMLITAAAHSPRALRQAARAGADIALLSPVFPTASHPQQATLGVTRFRQWARQAAIPVLALGGVTSRTLPRLKHSHAAGFATIRGFR